MGLVPCGEDWIFNSKFPLELPHHTKKLLPCGCVIETFFLCVSPSDHEKRVYFIQRASEATNNTDT